MLDDPRLCGALFRIARRLIATIGADGLVTRGAVDAGTVLGAEVVGGAVAGGVCVGVGPTTCVVTVTPVVEVDGTANGGFIEEAPKPTMVAISTTIRMGVPIFAHKGKPFIRPEDVFLGLLGVDDDDGIIGYTAWVTGYPMTVGAIHALPGSLRPFPNVLHGLPETAEASWCCRKDAACHYVAYVVGPNGEVVSVDDQAQAEHPPTGPMLPPGQHVQSDNNN